MFAQFKNRNDQGNEASQKSNDDSQDDVKVVPVDFKATISREGEFKMEFNQDMVVPFDISRRQL